MSIRPISILLEVLRGLPRLMMYTGQIKSFNRTKGWGFIECKETQLAYGKDVFVLKTTLPGAAGTKGDQVSFTVKDGEAGPEAATVQLLQSAGDQRAGFGKGQDLAMSCAALARSCLLMLVGSNRSTRRRAGASLLAMR